MDRHANAMGADREEIPISPLTPATQVLDFVCSHPGLLETCIDFPHLTAEYAPQLTIRGFGGPLEDTFEEQYQKSLAQKATGQNHGGTALTKDAAPPLCDEEWVLRHPTFGNFKPSHIAHEYFHGGMFGPTVSPYEEADHVFWLLSSASSWLPNTVHAVLLQGMKGWISWPWHDVRLEDERERWGSCGELWNALHTAAEKGRTFKWTERTKDDALNRISRTIRELKLPETPLEIFACFTAHQFPEHFVIEERSLRKRRTSTSATREKGISMAGRRSRQR
jgi:hypothetical protein